jgi:hypothetical protein
MQPIAIKTKQKTDRNTFNKYGMPTDGSTHEKYLSKPTTPTHTDIGHKIKRLFANNPLNYN